MNDFFHPLLGSVIALPLVCGVGSSAQAQTHARLVYENGPVLKQFSIAPLYYGDWSSAVDQAVLSAQQAYLKGLAAYLSGQGAPIGQRPTTWQYGVRNASVAGQINASPDVKGPKQICDPNNGLTCATSQTNVLEIIAAHEPKEANTAVVVFLPTGFTIPGLKNGCSYHTSQPNTTFYAVVQTESCGPLLAVTAHELFEAALDPVLKQGWIGTDGSEAVDNCSTYFHRADIDKSVGDIVAAFTAAHPKQTFPWDPTWRAAIPGIADNTQPDPHKNGNVLCSTTGYYSPPRVKGDIKVAGANTKGFTGLKCGDILVGASSKEQTAPPIPSPEWQRQATATGSWASGSCDYDDLEVPANSEFHVYLVPSGAAEEPCGGYDTVTSTPAQAGWFKLNNGETKKQDFTLDSFGCVAVK